jgi:hypothetical protein
MRRRQGEAKTRLLETGTAGRVGTVEKAWGSPHYTAVQVRLDGGGSELLWHHEVEVIREEIGEGAFVPLRWGTAVPARERPHG